VGGAGAATTAWCCGGPAAMKEWMAAGELACCCCASAAAAAEEEEEEEEAPNWALRFVGTTIAGGGTGTPIAPNSAPAVGSAMAAACEKFTGCCAGARPVLLPPLMQLAGWSLAAGALRGSSLGTLHSGHALLVFSRQ